jgi:hypothetical protein
MLTEYRQRYRHLQSALKREEFLFRTGRKSFPETAHFLAENSDLFSQTTIAELQKIHDDISENRETDRESLRLLIAFATEGQLTLAVRELSDEISRYEMRSDIQHDHRRLNLPEAFAVLRHETMASRRRELRARVAEFIRSSSDLFAERLEKLCDAARQAGFANYLTLNAQLRQIDYSALAAKSARLLSETEARYVAALSFILPRDAGLSLNAADRADLGWMTRLIHYDEIFPLWRLRGIYEETLRGLGILAWKQNNLEISNAHSHQCALVVPIQIPQEIRLVITAAEGHHEYQTFFQLAGRAQNFAWTSAQLPAEFQYGGDRAVTEAFGALFQFLLLDEKWLTEMLHFPESRDYRSSLAVHRLMTIRRYAARLIYETELHSDKLSGSAGARFAELMTDAVRVRYDATTHLRDLDDGLLSADYLRAWVFEAQLREYLKSRFGSRWWASRKAGEMLIDLWNTGRRYSLERLATMIGLGELSFDWLSAELTEQVKLK